MDIRRECLWLNKNIKIGNKEITWNAWHNKGINLIHDIANENGTFLSKANLEQKYNVKCDFLKYSALKDAIGGKNLKQ